MDYGEISVVVSGPIIETEYHRTGKFVNATSLCLQSVRKMLPGAEVVFSTWKNENLEGLDYDILVQSDDPGASPDKVRDGGNINRQICSRRAGIKAATRKFVLALRSESYIERLDFLGYWDRYKRYSEDVQWKFLEHRVVIPALMPADRAKLFHMGDWYYFGTKDDLLKLWDIPLWKSGTYNVEEDDLLYNAHRYVIVEFIKKFGTIKFNKRYDITKENREIYEKVVANNFVVTGFRQYGLDSYKYYYPKTFQWRVEQMEICYSHGEWVELYNKYCDGKEVVCKGIEENIISYIIVPIRRNLRLLKRWIKKVLFKEKEFYEY